MEKKYVLAKDTPMGKKGSMINYSGIDVCVVTNGYYHKISLLGENKGGAIARLLSEGWIEEVKPLEIWVNEYATPTQHPTEHLGEYNYTDFKKAQEAAQYSGSYIRTVHFIEAEETK